MRWGVFYGILVCSPVALFGQGQIRYSAPKVPAGGSDKQVLCKDGAGIGWCQNFYSDPMTIKLTSTTTGELFAKVDDGDEWGDFNFGYVQTYFPADSKRPCKTYRWGYNVGAGAVNVVPNDAGLHYEIESYFPTGANRFIESHLEYVHTATGKVIRLYSAAIDKNTDYAAMSFTADDTYFYANADGLPYFKLINNKLFYLLQPLSRFVKDTNNSKWLWQANTSAVIANVAYLDDRNVVMLGDATNAEGVQANGALSYSTQTLTVPDSGGAGVATATLTPTHSYVSVNCQDADGCDLTMGETGVVAGAVVVVVNSSANVCHFADTVGVSELAGAFAMGQYDSLSLIYAVDRWVETARSNN